MKKKKENQETERQKTCHLKNPWNRVTTAVSSEQRYELATTFYDIDNELSKNLLKDIQEYTGNEWCEYFASIQSRLMIHITERAFVIEFLPTQSDVCYMDINMFYW